MAKLGLRWNCSMIRAVDRLVSLRLLPGAARVKQTILVSSPGVK